MCLQDDASVRSAESEDPAMTPPESPVSSDTPSASSVCCPAWLYVSSVTTTCTVICSNEDFVKTPQAALCSSTADKSESASIQHHTHHTNHSEAGRPAHDGLMGCAHLGHNCLELAACVFAQSHWNLCSVSRQHTPLVIMSVACK